MNMMCRPKWPFLLMCVFHDVRHVEFRGLTGSQRTPRFWGVTDVVTIQAGHLLLGRSWKFDRKVKHGGFTNKYSFMHNQRTITLVPLTPSHVYEDHVRLQKESEQKRKNEKESEQNKKSDKKKLIENF